MIMSIFYEKNSETYFEVEYDEYADVESPREYGCNSTFITWCRNYSSPDRNELGDWDDMMEHFGTKNTGHMYNDLESLMENALKKGYVLLPVWKYEHGDVSFEASEHYPFYNDGYVSTTPGYEGGWDGGLCGVIFEKRNRRNVENLKDALRDEVEDYSKWCNGEYYRISAYDKEGEEIDSCGGFEIDYNKEKETIVEFANDFMGEDIYD